MATYIATEFDRTTCGRTETYKADSEIEAAQFCLYVRKLADGRAYLGPTQLVVHAGGMLWTLTSKSEANTR